MPQYTVLDTLGYDRVQPYMPGEIVAMPAYEAEGLIKAGVLGEAIPGTETTRLNVTETVKLVVAAATIEDLDTLATGEERKGVLEAIFKRRAELEEATA